MKTFIFIASFALIILSCGTNNQQNQSTTTDSTSVSVDTCNIDSVNADTVKTVINMNDIKV
jgi:hypothetical protein